MFIEKIPGVNVFFNFTEAYSYKNPLDILELFDDPRREKFGFFWGDLNSGFIKQTLKYGRRDFNFSGFYMSNYEDAAISMGIFNRYFYLSLMDKFKSWENMADNIVKFNGKERRLAEKMVWDYFYDHMKECFNYFYIPFKRFLGEKRPERCWVSFSDHTLTPSDPIYSDFLCGITSLEVTAIDPFFESKRWAEAIKDGPLGNPEMPIIEDFLHAFPECIKFAPSKIVEKLEIGFMGDLSDCGIL